MSGIPCSFPRTLCINGEFEDSGGRAVVFYHDMISYFKVFLHHPGKDEDVEEEPPSPHPAGPVNFDLEENDTASEDGKRFPKLCGSTLPQVNQTELLQSYTKQTTG